ncbi:MAG: ribonuclease III domain-containing protein [Bacteroidales bacterium]|nr:ribonuclease III domain-containing protein [Bacteroidales bacterium]
MLNSKDCSDIKAIKLFVENVFGFSPKNLHVYKLAFLHKSAAKEVIDGIRVSNERLEYLGDSILNAVIADYVYKKFPLKDEGFLTEIRSRIVNRKRLNKVAEKLGMHNLLLANSDVKSMNKDVIGNSFEALVGAIYIDKGFDFTKKVIIDKILAYHLDIDIIENENDNFKSQVINKAQSEKKSVVFKVENIDNLNCQKLYTVHLLIDNVFAASGQDYAIKKAEQNAAENFLKSQPKDIENPIQ